jgi:rhamnogalacturonyl hydrolase YesR
VKYKKKNILIEVLSAAKAQGYSGYSKFDALNSPFLKKLTFNNKWLRFFLIQVIKELPFNIRPILQVEKSRNPKGIALFARAYFFLYQLTGEQVYLEQGEVLLQWLLEHPSTGCQNLCWGYNFIWQSTLFLQDKFEPNAVVSTFVGEALVHGYRLTKKDQYLRAACLVADFIINDLPVLHDTEDERAIAYVLRKVDAIVLNNQVLTGAFLIKVWKETGNEKLEDIAQRQFNYTINRRTDYHAWYYTYPHGKSHITHDNYHTGGILDGILEYYEETGDDRYMQVYWDGLKYYQQYLFEPNGAPRWMNNKKYPLDIHGAAQGIISFAKAARHDASFMPQAQLIADWTLKHLYREQSQDFVYRQGRYLKWNYSLMRWCNAWMARALGELEYAART